MMICWHMHQPEYRDPEHGSFRFPWTYLHAIKDYVDMAAHLEQHPDARVVVNFAPVLLEQIDTYASRSRPSWPGIDTQRSAAGGAGPRQLCGSDPGPAAGAWCACLRANRRTIIDRFEPFDHLAGVVDWLRGSPDSAMYLTDQFLHDLLVWYHLGWMGETGSPPGPAGEAAAGETAGLSPPTTGAP